MLLILISGSGPGYAMAEGSFPEQTLEGTQIILAKIHTPEQQEPDVSPSQAFELPTDSSLVITDIYFDENRYLISQETSSLLEETIGLLKSEKDWGLHIESHCDERGTGAYNVALGDKRIQRVEEFLVDLGVEADRVWATSYGQTKPLCLRSTTTCLEENIRVQLIFQILAPRHSNLGCLVRLRLLTQDDPQNALQHLLHPQSLQPLRLAAFTSQEKR